MPKSNEDLGELQELKAHFEKMSREQAKQREAAARDPSNQKDPAHYAEAVQAWVVRDYWTLTEAANLLSGCDPRRPSGLPGHRRLDGEVQAMRELLVRADLTWRGHLGNKQVKSADLLAWVRRKGLGAPPALLRAAGVDLQADTEASSAKRPSQMDRELCRAIAATLWHVNPAMSIADVTRHPSLRKYGNGAQYTEATLRRWIRDLDPRSGQRVGRPRKSAG